MGMQGEPEQESWCLYYVKKSTKTRVIGVLLVGFIVGLAVPSLLDKYVWRHNKNIKIECLLPPAYRLDALSRFGNTTAWDFKVWNETCHDEFACPRQEKEGFPYCFHPHPANYSYQVLEILPCSEKSNRGFTVNARLKQPDKVKRNNPVYALEMKVLEVEDHRLVVKIHNKNKASDFNVDNFLSYDKSLNRTTCNREGRLYDLDHKPEVSKVIFVDVKRKTNGKSLFNTNFGPLMAEDKYMEITTVLPTNYIYGLGQGRHTTLKHNLTKSKTWTLFAGHDTSWGHGVHPFYLCLEEDGSAHGVLLEHSNAMEVTLQDVPSITYRSTGNSLTFHILLGPTPNDVIKQLTALVGRPALPPFWALGHHVCRTNESIAWETVEELRKSKVPHESDCFSDTLSLRHTQSEWTDVVNFTTNILQKHQKLILVQVPHVLRTNADSQSIYITNSNRNENAVGMLKGQEVWYPDYTRNLNDWPVGRLNKILDALKQLDKGFDGLLLTNSTPVDEREDLKICSKEFLNFPELFKGKMDLWNKTLCMDACHFLDKGQPCNRPGDKNHFNLHNIYSYKFSEEIYQSINKLKPFQNRRPFLASMSTFTGSGRFGGQFSVGFSSTWEDMKVSLVQSLEFNIYGIPMVGAPACGYHFHKDRDLCSRWVQMAAFQPFLLSYHHSNEEESLLTPVLMDDLVASIAAASFQLRYSLLPYLYTLFYYASKDGSPVMRPLFFEFPKDDVTRNIDEQFMWGPALMVSPVLHNSTVQFGAYFPEGVWYDLSSGQVTANSDKGAHKNLTATEYQVNIHIRGGYILAEQKQGIYVDAVRNSSYKLKVALSRPTADDIQTAIGQLYIDDGISNKGPSVLVHMEVKDNHLTLWPEFRPNELDFKVVYPFSYHVESIFIFGMRKSVPVYECHINDKKKECKSRDEHSTLDFRNLNINLLENNNITWKEA